MTSAIIVNAEWDDDAQVWVAQSPNLPGLVTEADSIEALRAKLPGMVLDLLETSDGIPSTGIPIEITAHANTLARAG